MFSNELINVYLIYQCSYYLSKNIDYKLKFNFFTYISNKLKKLIIYLIFIPNKLLFL